MILRQGATAGLQHGELVPRLGVSNVNGLIAPKRIFGNVGCMISDSLKGASDEDEVQVTWYILRV
jgi:hypothetical protein